MDNDPLAFLRAAHARAEKVATALPRGPWAWTRYSDPNWCHTLEGPDGFSEAVLKSATQSPGASWIELHPAFDEFLPDPEAVLRRITGERKLIAALESIDDNADYRLMMGEPVDTDALWIALAEAWGWTGEAT